MKQKKRARKSSKMICKRDTKTDVSFERPLSLYCFLGAQSGDGAVNAPRKRQE